MSRLNFNIPVYYNGKEGDTIRLPKENTVECVTLLQKSNRKPDTYVKMELDMEDYYRIKDIKKAEEDKNE